MAERGEDEMGERGAHAELAVRDRASLGTEPCVRVELFELGGIAERPVIAQRVLPEDVHRSGNVASARGALLLPGELAAAAHIEEPRIAGADGGEDLLLRRDDALAWMRSERRGLHRHLALLERPAFGDPLLDAALHD